MYEVLEPEQNKPVIEGKEDQEHIVGLDQTEDYVPVKALYSQSHPFYATIRFTLTDEQRKKVAEGADLYFTEMTFGNPFSPILIALGKDVKEDEVLWMHV